MDGYTGDLGALLLYIVSKARQERNTALLELAVRTAELAILEIPDGHLSPELQEAASVRCGRAIAEARLGRPPQGPISRPGTGRGKRSR